VQGADDILREQDDPAAFAAREQLAKSLEALRSLPQPDRTGLFLQLGALREQAAQLNTQAPVFVEGEGQTLSLAAEGDGSSRWVQWWEKISRYIRIDFDADQNIRPLLAGQSLAQVRLALSLALEQAQWAALHGEPQVYQQALAQARLVLDSHFGLDNPESRALHRRLGELGGQPVAVALPDLAPALGALQAYLQRRQAPPAAVEQDQSSALEEARP